SRKPGRKTGLFVFAFKKNPVPKGAGFFAVWGISHPVALRLPGLQNRTPDKVRSTASGENYAMFAPLSPFNAK
ncbi:TPA: hypothetical protein MH037_06620, partial [Klebsiella pneumoniae]|nr:hypothetical protein [Klebsiella pneumoniae]HBX4103341.1 hypothetical protein [Klebsiella pneumoniae]HBX4107489.1 hypothetical protein [Klebsiella pneumoniae]HCD1811252.1 hypothetical protein [Klebsiella pneumoniae]HDS3661334.1 hypothetical protein [Klebsiella pneumoniae subsp. pneumoniae]